MSKIDLPYDSLENFSLSGEKDVPAEWWTVFNDSSLNLLVDSALNSNLDLNTVWYQLQQARATVAISRSNLIPAVDFQARSGISRPEPDFVGGENVQFSVAANYELDLWGRIRYNLHADQYNYEASKYDYRTAALSLSGEVTLAWFRLKAAKLQYQLVLEQIENNEKVLSLIRSRFASGQIRGVDILRQRQLIEATRSQKINLETQIGLIQNQIAVLTGVPPTDSISVEETLPQMPSFPDTGIPMQLINRRPDVLSAYYRLQASDRSLAAAISNKYPRLNLSLTAAFRSNSFEGLLESQAYTLTGGILAPLFYGGRLNAQVDQAEAVRGQQLNVYGQIVLNAFQEVENALLQETKQVEQIAALESQVEMSEKVYGQLRIEYLNGSLPYLDVLVALNQQQQLKRDLIEAKLALFEIRVSLYRALAGGFELPKEIENEKS